jgi:hypothetical protein
MAVGGKETDLTPTHVAVLRLLIEAEEGEYVTHNDILDVIKSKEADQPVLLSKKAQIIGLFTAAGLFIEQSFGKSQGWRLKVSPDGVVGVPMPDRHAETVGSSTHDPESAGPSWADQSGSAVGQGFVANVSSGGVGLGKRPADGAPLGESRPGKEARRTDPEHSGGQAAAAGSLAAGVGGEGSARFGPVVATGPAGSAGPGLRDVVVLTTNPEPTTVLVFDARQLKIDPETGLGVVTVGGNETNLNPAEAAVLKLLIDKATEAKGEYVTGKDINKQ